MTWESTESLYGHLVLSIFPKATKKYSKYLLICQSSHYICNLQYRCEIIMLLLSGVNFTKINFTGMPVILTIEWKLGCCHETSWTLRGSYSLIYVPWFSHLQRYPIKNTFLFKFPDILLNFCPYTHDILFLSHLNHFHRFNQISLLSLYLQKFILVLLTTSSFVSPSFITFIAEKPQIELGWIVDMLWVDIYRK